MTSPGARVERRAFDAIAVANSATSWLIFGAIGLFLLGNPILVQAQTTPNVWRIGYLSPGLAADETGPASRESHFRQGLQELGYVEGQNMVIESRYAGGSEDRLSTLALELVRAKVAVIVTWGPGIRVAKRITGTIPIVMTSTIDAVASGLVDSLARPGGNVTGITLISTELMGKRLELLREAIPRLARLALLAVPLDIGPATEQLVRATETAAKSLAIRLRVLRVRQLSELDAAFAAMARERVDALYVVENPALTIHIARILDLARRQRLPTMLAQSQYAEAGALITYGPNVRDMNRRAATYVDRILKGSKPADLPVEQPTKFELVINLKTAKALNLTIPQSVLLRADQVIE
jgi:putative ABC transport system substrate-binding protein